MRCDLQGTAGVVPVSAPVHLVGLCSVCCGNQDAHARTECIPVSFVLCSTADPISSEAKPFQIFGTHISENGSVPKEVLSYEGENAY